ARESPIGEFWRERIGCWDGSETTFVSPAFDETGMRVFASPGSAAMGRLQQAAQSGKLSFWAAVRDEVGWSNRPCISLGQDAALAAQLARKHVTVGGIVQATERAIDDGVASAIESRPLSEGSALAAAHGTRYPVLHGPMTRVSDAAAFAVAVARGGALPF